MFEMPTAEALTRYLTLASQQMKLTAANMANIDTPGYKTTGMDFQGEFSKALDSHSGSQQQPVVGDVEGLIARPDGNNVSIDRESMSMAQTQLQFRTGIELLRHEYTRVMDAIKSDMR
jgi:flagellar basal-body rod protein FlgB